MKRLWLRLRKEIDRDDLFWRVLSLLFGIVLGGLGIALLYFFAAPDLAFPWRVALWIVALLLAAWSVLLIARCILPAHSRTSRLADKVLPDGTGEEGILLGALFFIPALLLTVLLRSLGVRGTLRRKHE